MRVSNASPSGGNVYPHRPRGAPALATRPADATLAQPLGRPGPSLWREVRDPQTGAVLGRVNASPAQLGAALARATEVAGFELTPEVKT